MNFKTIIVFSLTMLLTLGLAGCGDSSDSPENDESAAPPQAGNPSDTGTSTPSQVTVAGVVRDYFTGEPVTGASVAIGATGSVLVEGITGEDGRFSVPVPDGLARISVNADADGYGGTSSIASTDGTISSSGLELSLIPANRVRSFPASSSAALTVEDLDLVELGANAFVLPDGSVYSGDVEAELTIIDPSSDPGVMPGGYEAVGEDGTQGFMESWGAITATFETESGEDLQLAQGETATIRIPLAGGRSASQSPATIPLFFYDETAGIWREEGAATLVTENDVSFYLGTVSHFTSWNADSLYESVDVTGRVVDETGNPVANATVVAQGQNYIGSSRARTAADGTFSLPVRPESNVLIAASRNALSNTLEVSVPNADLQLPQDIILSQAAVAITLTWDENPRDLDSHLFGPANEDGSSEFHVNWLNKTEVINDTIINLDVDDTNSFGPEVITVPRFPFPGTYRYLVKRFIGSGTIESSPARIELAIDGETRVFSPTQAQGTVSDWWAVFNLVVDVEGNVAVNAVQEWRNSSNNPVQATVSSSALGVVEGNDNPINGQINRKYYSQ